MSVPSSSKNIRSSHSACAAERRQVAEKRALAALERLEAFGFAAWVTGSLAKGRFTGRSDVDFLIDGPPELELDAALIIEGAMGDMAFDLIPMRLVKESGRPFMTDTAIDASILRARAA
jgi:predicted nucleotidyltransferase